MILIWFHLEAPQRSIVNASFLLMALASWHLVGWRCFVNLLRRSVLVRSVDWTLALRACFCVVHLHASDRKRGQRPDLLGYCTLLGLASWLSESLL